MSDPIDRLRARVDALPPGPHEVTAYSCLGAPPEETAAWIPTLATLAVIDADMMSESTAETVAVLVTAAPALLAVVEAVEHMRRRYAYARDGEVTVDGLRALWDTSDALDAALREVLR